MKLTEDERAFIARWLMEFGGDPVSAEIRRESEWYMKTNFLPYMDLYDLARPNGTKGVDDWLYFLEPRALEAFNKGDSNE